MTVEFADDDRAVLFEQVPPLLVAESCSPQCRRHNVGEQYGRENPVAGKGPARSSDELLHLGEKHIRALEEWQVIRPGNVDDLRAGYTFAHVARRLDLGYAIAGAVQQEGRRLDCCEQSTNVEVGQDAEFRGGRLRADGGHV